MKTRDFAGMCVVAAVAIVLCGCAGPTRGNSDVTGTRAAGDTPVITGNDAAGATGSSTLSGPNNVGGTVGSGSGSVNPTDAVSGTAAGVPHATGGR